jgi:hypothetical protein
MFDSLNQTIMKTLLQAEQAAQLTIAILGLYFQPISISWWIWPFLFLSPDISMLGYLVNTQWGAVCYNLFHHKLTAVIIVVIGYFLHNDIILFIGLLLYAHSSFDRLFGYGLKYPDNFKHTHLGQIGKAGKE